MQNYKYRFTDGYEILNEEEHGIIKSNLKQGKTKTFLRNGELMINSTLLSRIIKTTEPTEKQDLISLEAGRIFTEARTVGNTKGLERLGDWVKKQSWGKNKVNS